MKIRILRYGASDSVNRLVEILKGEGHDVKKLMLGEASSYCGIASHLVVNWGSSDRAKIRSTVRILNDPAAVGIVSNKLRTFQTLSERGFTGRIPDWTQDIDEAKRWIREEFTPVYCRTILQGSQGNDIIVAEREDQLVPCRLYVKKLPVDREIRVHVFGGSVIDFSQKKVSKLK